MKKILITGDTGLLGSNAVKYFNNLHKVYGISRSNVGLINVKHYSIDLSKYKDVKSVIGEIKPDIILHTAALTDVDFCEENPKLAKMINEESTKILSELCYISDIPIIYISTDAFYCQNGGKLSNEKSEVFLKSVYAETKYNGEEFILPYNKGLVIRTNIYGYNFLNKYSFGEWIMHSLIQNKTIKMFDDVFFSPILVNELCEIIDLAINRELYGLYNIGGSEGLSKYEFGKKLKQLFDINSGNIEHASVNDHHFNAWRSSNMAMDNSLIKRELGIKISNANESINYFLKLNNNNYQTKLRGMYND